MVKSEGAGGRARHLLEGCCSIQRRNGGGLDQAAGVGSKKGKILASELRDELNVEYGRKEESQGCGTSISSGQASGRMRLRKLWMEQALEGK